MNNRIFRIAVIGCGAIHHSHAGALAGIPGVELRTVCDIRPERARASAARYGAEAVFDAGEVLARGDIDAVHLCTPHHLHAPMAIRALEAGKYVLVEKPMAITREDARAMIAASDRAGGRLGVVFQNRYLRAARRLREIAAGGEMGALLGIRGAVPWRRTPEYYADDWHGRWATEGGGVMMNQAIHTLDLMLWCAGRPAVRVSGRVSTDGLDGVIEVEDTAHLRVEFEGGLIGTFYATVAGSENEPVEIHALLEGGRLLYRNGWLYRWEDGGSLALLCGPEGRAEGEKAYWGIGHPAQIADFYDSVRTGKPVTIDGREGYRSLRVIRALYEASRTGQPQELD